MLYANGAVIGGRRRAVQHRIGHAGHGGSTSCTGDLHIEGIGRGHGSAGLGNDRTVTHKGCAHAGIVGSALHLVTQAAIVFGLHKDVHGVAQAYGRIGGGYGKAHVCALDGDARGVQLGRRCNRKCPWCRWLRCR